MHTRTTLQPCKSHLPRASRSRGRVTAPGPAALTFAVSLSLGAVQPALSGPTGGVVVGGQGTISTPNANTTVVNQSSNRLQLNWSSFNVGASESVLFQQPSSTAVAFNRILDQSPSQIFGHIQGNGQVVLINPNGFLIGRTAQLNVNSLVVSSLDAIDFDAGSGRYRFSSISNPGAVINEGTITAGRGGSVTLLGGQVSNSGSIVADFGTVNLAAGRAATLDLAGDGILRLEVDQQLLTNSSGSASAVENTGSIRANGGQVLLSASAVKDVFANLINNTGLVHANRIDNSGGTIELLGPGGEVTSSGTLDASAGDDKSTGGSVSVLGEHVGLFGNAVVDVSGATGGGTALIGGDYHGGNPDVLNAQRTYVSAGSTIDADAGSTGDGGHVVVWADEFTRFGGNISARGGALSGNGGFVEVSGKQSLEFAGRADLTAAHGTWGTLLLDPDSIAITNSTTDDDFAPGQTTVSFGDLPTLAVIGGPVIAQLLTTGSVILQANNQITQAPGADIDAFTLHAPASSSLTLTSSGTMTLQGNISTNGGAVTLTAPGDVILSGNLATHGGAVDIESSIFSVDAHAGAIDAQTGNVHLAADGFVSVGSVKGGAVDLWATQGDVIGSASPIEATSLNLKAGGVIGPSSAGGVLVTKTAALQATAATGSISIDNQEGVSLDSVTANGSNSNITITADSGDIQIGSVSAPNSVQLIASAGAILNGTTPTPIQTSNLILTARDDIGSSSSYIGAGLNPTGAAPITATLTANSTDGSVFVRESGVIPYIVVNANAGGAGETLNIDGASSNLIVGAVGNANGSVTLSGNNIVDDGDDTTKINASSTHFNSGGAIGGAFGSQDIDIVGGLLTAAAANGVYVHSDSAVTLTNLTSTSGSIAVTADTGNISVGTVGAPTSVSLIAQGNAGQGGAIVDAGSQVSSGALTLTAARAIGASTQAINTFAGAAPLSLIANTTQSGGIYVANKGNLFLNTVNAGGAGVDVSISATSNGSMAGDITVQNVSATGPLDKVELDAAGSIVGDHNDSTVIAGYDVTLLANSAVGAAGAHNQIDTSASFLTAAANGGGVYIGDVNLSGTTLKNITAPQSGADVVVSTIGDMIVGAVSANHSVSLTSGGAIKDDGSSSTFVSSGALSLTASGSIGATGAGNQIATEVGSLTATATGAGSSLFVDNLVGDLTIGAVSAQGVVALTAKTGALLDDGDDNTVIYGGTGVALQAATGIGTVTNFAAVAGSSVDVLTNGALSAAVASNSGQINLNISGAPVIGTGAITLGSGSGRAGTVILQSPNDLNVAGLGAGAISIGAGNTTNVGLSSGGVLIVPSSGGFTDAPAHNLLVRGSIDVVDNDATPRELSFNAAALNFQSGAAGGGTILDTSVSRLDATIGNSRDLVVNQAGGMTIGAISAPGGNVSITANGALADDGDDTTQISALAVNLTATALGAAGNPNQIDTHAATLNATATAGGIYIREAGASALIANATGGAVDVQTANGALTVTQAKGTGVTLSTLNAGNDLIVNGTVNGGSGPVNLTTFGNGSDIDVNAVVGTTGSAVTLVAGPSTSRGAIVAGNGNGIVASTLTATGSAIGATTARLNTDVSSLNATATNGGLFVTEASALSLTASSTGGPVDVQTTNGTLNVISAKGNGISLTAGGDNNALTLAGTVDGSGGNIGLTAGGAGGQINVNGQVTTSASVALAAGTGVVPGAIQSSGGNITANALTVMGGSIGSASSRLSTTVASLNATSINSDIYVQNSAPLTLTATAPGTVQVSTANGSLTVDSVISGSTGGVNLTAGGAGSNLILDGVVSAGSGQVKLTAAGDIVADTGNLISGSSAVLRASSIGLGSARLNTALDSLDAATTNGSIFVSEADALTLSAAATNGAVDVRTMNGALTVASAVGDGVTLAANGDGNALTVNSGPGSGVQAHAGDVALTTSGAGSDVLLNGTVVTTGNIAVSASGTIAANAGSNLAGGKVNLSGAAIGTSAARINTAATSLNATSSNGGIYVNEVDGLTLTANATGGVLDVMAGGPLVVSSASGEGVTLIATANNSGISVNGPVNAGAGPLTLAATGAGGTIDVNGIATTLGDATLIAGSTTGRGAVRGAAGGQISAVSLSVLGSAIGTSTSALNTAVTSLNTTSTNGSTFVNEADSVTLTANATGGGVDVQTTNGALVVNGASGTGVFLTTGGPNNSITLNGSVAGGTGGVTLTAGTTSSRGAIVAGSGGAVTGGTLTAVGSAIGSGAAPLSTTIDTLNADAGTGGVHISEQNGLTLASVHSVGDVDVTTASGNINIASVTTSANAALTSSSGAITDDGDDSTVLSAQGVTLLARSIGAPSTLTGAGLDAKSRVDITAKTLNATATAGGVYIDALNGLASASVHADGGANGNIELLAPNGDLNLLAVSASNTLLLSAGRNILALPGLGQITARSAELRAGASDANAGHIGTLMQPLSLQLDPGNTLRIFVPQTVDSNDPNRAPATLPSAGVLTTLSLFGAPSALAVEAGYAQFQGLSDTLYTSQAESLVHSIQNQTAVVQTVLGLDWGSFDPSVSLFGTLDPSVCLPSDQRDEEAGAAGC